MPPKNNAVDIVQMATNAAREYVDVSDRLVTLVERLGDAHAKLLQTRRQRDELLLSAVSLWHSLKPDDQQRLSALMQVVNHRAAENLLASIRKQQHTTAPEKEAHTAPNSSSGVDEKKARNG